MPQIYELRRQQGALRFARRLLNGAVLFQLPFLIELVLRQSDLLFNLDILGTRQMPGKLAFLLWATSSLLAIEGFAMVCLQLSLWEGDLENTDLARSTRLLGSRKIAASMQLVLI